MRTLLRHVSGRCLALLSLSFSLDVTAGQREIWQCEYKTIYDKGFAFNSEFEIVDAKKLLGPFDDYSGRRLEYNIIRNNAVGLIALSSYFNNHIGATTSGLMGMTTVSLQKKTGKFKLIASQVGEADEEKYIGTCKLRK